MARISQNATLGYSLADAKQVFKAAGKHWAALEALGATDAERKRFAQTIADAEKAAVPAMGDGPITLEEARQDLKDRLGAYRSAASLVAYGINGRDEKAEKALKMKGNFPDTDALLSGYVQAITAPMKSYSAKLAARGFDREAQAELVKAGKSFNQAFASRGKERGAARAERLSRESLFKQLRTQTTYFRRVGREALRSSVGRADFDRVQLPAKAPVETPSTTTTAPPAAP